LYTTFFQKFFDLTNSAQISENLCQFSIEREKLHRFLQEQRERCPQSSFHNVDVKNMIKSKFLKILFKAIAL
jgi:DUF1365 family protein